VDLSLGALLTSLFVSTIGFGLFLYGKKATRVPQLGVGLAMMVYPYFVGSTFLSLGLAGSLMIGLWIALRAGI
jgi:hypothetical protein